MKVQSLALFTNLVFILFLTKSSQATTDKPPRAGEKGCPLRLSDSAIHRAQGAALSVLPLSGRTFLTLLPQGGRGGGRVCWPSLSPGQAETHPGKPCEPSTALPDWKNDCECSDRKDTGSEYSTCFGSIPDAVLITSASRRHRCPAELL